MKALFGLKERKWKEEKLRKSMNELGHRISLNSSIGYRNFLSFYSCKNESQLFRLLIMVKESISSKSFDIYNGCSRSVIYRHLVFIHLFFSSNLKKNIKLVFQI
jgi:hypothetical protein